MSSSPADDSFAGFLGRSLAILERELPLAYAQMCARATPREVLIEIDGEPVSLAFEAAAHRLLPRPERPAVEVHATQRVILDLIDGRVSLLDAVLEERIVMLGGVPDIGAFHDGLMAYLHGAVRCRSFPELLRRYRACPLAPERQRAHGRGSMEDEHEERHDTHG